jgi:c-di-AMP phosphodiesterase-like protein
VERKNSENLHQTCDVDHSDDLMKHVKDFHLKLKEVSHDDEMDEEEKMKKEKQKPNLNSFPIVLVEKFMKEKKLLVSSSYFILWYVK